jgi:sugar lactone lactonase YvrE
MLKLKKALIIALGYYLIPIGLMSQSATTLVDVNSINVNDGIVEGANNTFYVSSFILGSIYKFDLTGSVQQLATGLETSNGLYINSIGELMACDPDGNRIYVIDTATGVFLDTIGIHSPAAIAKIPNNDTLLVTDWRSNKIYKLAPDGSSTTYLSGSPLNAPVGICYLASAQSIVIGNFNDRKVYKIVNNSLVYIATVPALNTPGNKWLGFITCSANRIYATSLNSHTIYEIFPNYTDSVKILSGTPGIDGQIDGPLDSASFYLPNGILSIGNGDSLLVSDYGNNAIRLLSLNANNVGIENYQMDKAIFNVFPNPADRQVHIKLEGNVEIEEIRLISVSGKVVQNNIAYQRYQNQLSITLKEEYSGYYFIQLKSQNTWTSQKIYVN